MCSVYILGSSTASGLTDIFGEEIFQTANAVPYVFSSEIWTGTQGTLWMFFKKADCSSLFLVSSLEVRASLVNSIKQRYAHGNAK